MMRGGNSHAGRTRLPYDGGMNRTLLAIAACAALAASPAPAPAADFQLNGQLPMYPNAKQDPRENVPVSALARGVPLVILTGDSVHTVDTWYASHVPKACARQQASGGVKYACPTGSIMIYTHGQTQIAFVPAFPKF